jgi:Cys-tRNA synthase (O-phospho-L-seryl-tRNA:Cys-tRNA synthase)
MRLFNFFRNKNKLNHYGMTEEEVKKIMMQLTNIIKKLR